ncbi:hypothetical protein AB0M48_09980 [Lentzea sp. NPDC051208]|uniref:hypothetical protein n=1 Tax=Lentzea sp. NPDC051208 TaxID=3154642 RepID=UPI00342000A9
MFSKSVGRFGAVVAAVTLLIVDGSVNALAQPTVAQSAAPVECVAKYEPADGRSVGGAVVLVLKSYSCGDVTSQWWSSIKLFKDANFSGDSLTLEIPAPYRSCDQDGMRIDSLPSEWDAVTSSFRVYNECWHSRLYTEALTAGDCRKYKDDVSYVGDFMNDKMMSVRLQSVERAC